ncbi:RNA12 protein-domain-containing protein [Roridomyces roridus]|uniref:Mitochondrial escape protein 2 n=1 Tax=Roridomyces roridus TaxID=1738132 RepID=A0AAD7BX58_9AGAR|nr:RNA12 protein-domain-containing protein [Roridomyces roridus]
MLRHIHRPLRRLPLLRYSHSETRPLQGRVFIDALPVRLFPLDLRYFVALLGEEELLERIRSRLTNIKSHAFTVIDIEPYHKDGGIFVSFEYTASDPDDALKTIRAELEKEAKSRGGLPSWLGSGAGVWMVNGQPWIEDIPQLPSNWLSVAFDGGPDIGEERLYELFRPYGMIRSIDAPTPVPAGTLRSANVVFDKIRYAATARNAMHGTQVFAPGSKSPTRLHLTYTFPLNAHKVRDWLASHPRVVLPVAIFLLGTLTYAIFDPIRATCVQAKMENWLDVREFRLYKWVRDKSLELRIFEPTAHVSDSTEEVWKERKQAETDLQAYLQDWPSTISFISGPQGAGKAALLDAVLEDTDRSVLTIDCREFQEATSDTQLVNALARQVGYRPVFSFFSSFNNMIDVASVAMIGQKANLSTSLPDQVRGMLSVVRKALQSANSSHQRDVQREIRRQARAEEHARRDAILRERILRGIWHDGRLDCVSGNGVISELGVGDEILDGQDVTSTRVEEKPASERKKEKQVEAVGSLPIVVIRNFSSRGSTREEVFDVIAEWAAGLVENQFAHVVVVSDNRENSKRLAKALPSKPLHAITLYDADAKSSLAFVKRKLKDADINLDYTTDQVAAVQRLGGRASDLESLVHKIRNGSRVEEAVEDIISRGVSELRKNAFGDDSEDAKHLPWGREHAWLLFKLLAKDTEVPYHQVLLEFPFKGDEAPLRALEHAEIITIGTAANGRPSTIRPGKPVYRYVFERLVTDPIFSASQDIMQNEKLVASAESTIKSCEQELLSLREINKDNESWWHGAPVALSSRTRYLLSKMRAATIKIEGLERRNAELKKVLAKGD